MRLYEYEAKKLFSLFKIPVTMGEVVETKEVEEANKDIVEIFDPHEKHYAIDLDDFNFCNSKPTLKRKAIEKEIIDPFQVPNQHL